MATPNTVETVLNSINLANTVLNSVVTLLTLIKNSDPNKTIAEVLSESNADIDANMAQIEQWMKDHGYR